MNSPHEVHFMLNGLHFWPGRFGTPGAGPREERGVEVGRVVFQDDFSFGHGE